MASAGDRAFLWATGIEDTFITVPWPATGRTLDEYALTQHYERWREDLRLMSRLGVGAARYGIPWHRVQPRPERFDWSWPDRTLELLLELGIQPIVDLVHYGTPGWLEGAFMHADYPRRVAEYAFRLAGRFADRIAWFTPLNEPRITAWYAGRVGLWPPKLRGWRGFTRVMLQLARGICETVAALRAALAQPVIVHVDATDLYVTADPALEEEAALRQQIGFLALDLVTGRVGERHPLEQWLRRNGMLEDDASWFAARRVELDVVGLNMYPMFSLKRLARGPRGLRQRMPYAGPEVLERLVELYAARYEVPLMITETASRGSWQRRVRWMDASIEVVRRCRAQGVPLMGYTWWPMFALVSWAYRTGTRPLADYLEQFGLWDLAPEPGGGLRREETPLVARYRERIAGGMV